MDKTKNIFAVFINLLGLLSAALYFAGWMYRLAYYSRFSLNVIELNFSFESFILVPIIVAYSEIINLLISGKILFVLLFVFSASIFVFFLWKLINILLDNFFFYLLDRISDRESKLYRLIKHTHFFIKKNNFLDITFILIFALTFFSFFWFKGFTDGYRDSNVSSTLLPYVRLLSSSNSISPQLAKPNKYHLLLRQDDWIYLVASPERSKQERLEVVMVTKGEGGDKVIFINEETE